MVSQGCSHILEVFHERQWGVFRTGELNQALTVIISAYDKRWHDQQGGR